MNDREPEPATDEIELPIAINTADVLWGVPRMKDLMFSRQLAADKQLAEHCLALRVRAFMKDTAADRLEWWQKASFPLSCSDEGILAQALARVRIRLRLAYELKVYMSVDVVFKGGHYQAIREGNTLHLFFSQPFYRITDVSEWAYHLANAAWKALDEEGEFVNTLMEYPLEWEALLEVFLRQRFAAYSAAIYGLLASGGDADLAIRESWRSFSAIASPMETPILAEMSAVLSKNSDPGYWERQLQGNYNSRYSFALPKVLRCFLSTDTCRDLLGSASGGGKLATAMPWKEFDAKVEAIDEHMHAPTDEWLSHLGGLNTLMQPLATAWMLEACPEFTKEEIVEGLKFGEMLDEDTERLFEGVGWQAGPDGNTASHLQNLSESGTNSVCARFFKGDLLRTMAAVLLLYGGRKHNDLLEQGKESDINVFVERYVKMAEHLGVTEHQARALLDTISDDLKQRSEEEEEEQAQ